MTKDAEGQSTQAGTTSKEAKVNRFPSIPDQMSQEWVEQALKAGKVERDGKEYFVRRYPESTNERVWLSDNYGLPTSGPEGEGYVYHGTNVESLPSIVDRGVFGVPDHPTVSTDFAEEVKNSAYHRLVN